MSIHMQVDISSCHTHEYGALRSHSLLLEHAVYTGPLESEGSSSHVWEHCQQQLHEGRTGRHAP